MLSCCVDAVEVHRNLPLRTVRVRLRSSCPQRVPGRRGPSGPRLVRLGKLAVRPRAPPSRAAPRPRQPARASSLESRLQLSHTNYCARTLKKKEGPSPRRSLSKSKSPLAPPRVPRWVILKASAARAPVGLRRGNCGRAPHEDASWRRFGRCGRMGCCESSNRRKIDETLNPIMGTVRGDRGGGLAADCACGGHAVAPRPRLRVVSVFACRPIACHGSCWPLLGTTGGTADPERAICRAKQTPPPLRPGHCALFCNPLHRLRPVALRRLPGRPRLPAR